MSTKKHQKRNGLLLAAAALAIAWFAPRYLKNNAYADEKDVPSATADTATPVSVTRDAIGRRVFQSRSRQPTASVPSSRWNPR